MFDNYSYTVKCMTKPPKMLGTVPTECVIGDITGEIRWPLISTKCSQPARHIR